LQLYKLLSIYSLLKPPKFGNCTVEPSDDAKPLITISEIKLIFNSKNNNPSALDVIKKKMDGLVEDGDWEFSDVFELLNHSDTAADEEPDEFDIICIQY